MNKYLFVLSMTAMLIACSSAPEVTDPDALPDGIMQPVEGTGAIAGGSFMPEIEQNSMPNTMK